MKPKYGSMMTAVPISSNSESSLGVMLVEPIAGPVDLLVIVVNAEFLKLDKKFFVDQSYYHAPS